MKHCPFESIYREDFQVVEQRRGNVSLFPHTEQLSLLLRALNLEFYGGLPGRIARVDHRADGFHKIVLKTAALIFCSSINGSRLDRLRLFRLLNHDLVSQVSIVQQITEQSRRGPFHRFRFYAGDDFFPEIRLSGKRLAFADHVLQRFSARVPNNVGEDLSHFLLTVFGSPLISLLCGPGRAFLVPYEESILAFPYKEADDEYFITTCLSINEINSLEIEFPPQVFNLHYGPSFTEPKVRNWVPTKWTLDLYRSWERKSPLPPRKAPLARKEWHRFGHSVKDHSTQHGHGPGSRCCFLDNIPGPCAIGIRPGQKELRHDELAAYKKSLPQYDWDEILAERAA
jgi:hypothetical protein